MKRIVQVAGLAALITLTYLMLCHTVGMKSVEYRGAAIRLRTCYLDYDGFKNDPNNLAAFEYERVQRLMAGAPIARSFPAREQMVHAVFDLKFPGYGLASFGESTQSDGSSVAMFAIEIPRGGERYLVFISKEGRFSLLDDFVDEGKVNGAVHQDGADLLDQVTVSEHKIVYSASASGRVVERPLRDVAR